MLPVRFGRTDAVEATVLTVSVAVPLPPLTVEELRPHFGGTAADGVMAQVRFTVVLKPPEAVTVTADVAEAPGVMLAGASGAAARLNPATVRLAVAVWSKVPS